jgi:hypothetical protein
LHVDLVAAPGFSGSIGHPVPRQLCVRGPSPARTGTASS